MILFNGNIYISRHQFVEAILIQDGIIVNIGTDADIMALREEGMECIDLLGKTVVPGFHDSHMHFYSTAVAMASVNLYGANSIASVIARGSEFLAGNPVTSGTLWGRGWNQDYFVEEQRLLTRFDLDQISQEIPIVFARACGHVVTCNTLALQLCNIESTTEVDGGVCDLDEEGIPNGILRENAIGLLDPIQNVVTVEQVVETLNWIAHIANAHGITSVQSNDITVGKVGNEIIEEAYQIYASETPTVRVYHQICFSDLEQFQQRITTGYDRGQNNAFNRYGPLKMFVDGSLGARTALMREPYHDDASTSGIACLTQEQLQAFIQMADGNGIQVAIHAIGDGAMEKVLDGYQRVITAENTNRHGIIHCQITDLGILNRFQAMDILAYVQPIFLHYDMHIVEDRVGTALAATSYAFHTMDTLGLHVSYGSDAPVEQFNVMNNLHCAVNRQDLNAYPAEGFYPTECVDVYQAVDNATLGSAYASFDENRKGRLNIGYLADLVVLSAPIFEIPSNQIKDVQIEMTMVNGQIVYTRA